MLTRPPAYAYECVGTRVFILVLAMFCSRLRRHGFLPAPKAHGAEAFRAEVIDTAVPWSDWHGDRILAEHDFASDANAFRRCTDRLTGFISDLSIPTDQTYHVHRFARALAGGEIFCCFTRYPGMLFS